MKKTLPWARMLSYMFDNLKTKSFGSWDTNHWDVYLESLTGTSKAVCLTQSFKSTGKKYCTA